MKFISRRTLLLLPLYLVVATFLRAQPENTVIYNPETNIVQGNQPLTDSYELSITSPSTLIDGNSVSITFGLSVLSTPDGGGVSDAQALGFISVNPATLTFTGPNQLKKTTVTVAVPLGQYAGNYAYRILPAGWPAVPGGINDAGATVNARVAPPLSTDTTPPSVTLLSPADGTVYTYLPASGNPLSVPVSFSASTGTGGSPIGTMQASIQTPANTDLPVSLTTGLLPAASASASGSVPLVVPGNYKVTVSAGNSNGTSYASSNISVVVVAPAPTVAVSAPLPNSTFSYTLGGAGAVVPVSFTATSIYGFVTSLGATLDGNPVALTTNGVGNSMLATGSASLTVSATGNHSLVFTAANAFGSATPVTVPFSVTGTVPVPTVAILSPASGASFTWTAGGPATTVNYSFQGGTGYGTISTVTASLDGAPVPVAPTVSGLNTAAITGSGSLSFGAGGSHTLNVKVFNSGGAMASTSVAFNVTEIRPQICEDLTWLPPISLNKTVEGGSEVPIKFTLECNNKFVRDTSVLIAIYEVFRNGSTSTPVIYHYGTGSPNPPDYAIMGKQYHLNFDTAKGTHSYQIEVYTEAAGSMRLLGSTELNTKGKVKPCGHYEDDSYCHNNGHERDCHYGRDDRNDRDDRDKKGGKNDRDDDDDDHGGRH